MTLGLYKYKEEDIDKLPKEPNLEDYLPIEDLRNNVKQAGTGDKSKVNELNVPTMDYDSKQYLPTNQSQLQSQSKEQEQSQSQSQNQSVRNQSTKEREYEYDYSMPISSIFDKEFPDMREYDERRQKLRENQSKLTTIGDVFTSMGDGLTLGMGGYVVPREFNKNEKYIEDYLAYKDKYNKDKDDWNYKQYLSELENAYRTIGVKQKDRALGQTDTQIKNRKETSDRAQDLQKEGLDNNKEIANRRLNLQKEGMDNENALANRRLKLMEDEFKEKYGKGEIEYTVPTSAGNEERTITPKDATEIFTNALSDPEFLKEMEGKGIISRNPPRYNEYGGIVDEGGYSLNNNLSRVELAIMYDKYQAEKTTSAPKNWRDPGAYPSAARNNGKDIIPLIPEEVKGKKYDISPETNQAIEKELNNYKNTGDRASIRNAYVALRNEGMSHSEANEAIGLMLKSNLSPKEERLNTLP